MLKLNRMQPPVRRVLAIDAGSRCIKLLLAQSDFGHLRILREELIDLQAEGLVSAGEIKAHLQASLDDWGRPPLALVLPQHLSAERTPVGQRGYVRRPAVAQSPLELLPRHGRVVEPHARRLSNTCSPRHTSTRIARPTASLLSCCSHFR